MKFEKVEHCSGGGDALTNAEEDESLEREGVSQQVRVSVGRTERSVGWLVLGGGRTSWWKVGVQSKGHGHLAAQKEKKKLTRM